MMSTQLGRKRGLQTYHVRIWVVVEEGDYLEILVDWRHTGAWPIQSEWHLVRLANRIMTKVFCRRIVLEQYYNTTLLPST